MFLYNISNTTLFIVIGFLLATLILGLYAGRNIKDIKDYALGGKNFSTVTLTLTLLATYIGGGATIGTVREIYSIGIIVIVAYFGRAIQNFILAMFIAPKITSFKDCITLGDLAKQLYGKNSKILVGFCTLLYALFAITVQFYMIGKIFNALLGIKIIYGIVIGGTVLGVYSALGGIKAVTFTDVLHFIILIIVIPFIATVLVKQIGGYKELFTNIPTDKLSIFNNKKFYYYLVIFLTTGIFPRMISDPAIMQRMFMSKDKKQIKNKFLVASIIDPLFRITILLIGLSLIILYPNMKSQEPLFYLITNKFQGGILQGLAISSLLAVVMSSADSYVHSGGLVLTRDILKPFLKKNKFFNELTFSRITTIIVSSIAIFLAIEISNGFNFRNMTILQSIAAGPILLFPLFIGILGIKADKKSLFIGIITGLICIILSKIYLPTSMKMLSIPISIIANAIAYMLTHIIQNKGIAWIQRDEETEDEEGKEKTKTKTNLWIPRPIKIIKALLSYIPGPKDIYNYSRFQVMKYGSENIIFGIYCCVNFTLPYVMWDSNDPERYNLMTNLRFIGGIMAGLLIVKDEWKNFLKPYYPLYWHATLTYCLPFITTVMFLLSKGSLLWLIQIAISIFMLVILVAGEVFLILAPLGILLGLAFYKYFVGPINILGLGFDTNYYLIYALVFPTIIGLLFAYKKRIFNRKTVNIGINLGLSLCHEIRNTLSALSYSDMAKRTLDRIKKTSEKESRNGKKVLVVDQNSFESAYNFVDTSLGLNYDTVKVLSAFENLFIEMKKSNINMEIDSVEETVHNTLTDLHFHPGQLEKVEVDLRNDFLIQLPKAQFSFVLSNLIRNAFKHGGPTKVEI
ncbi:MAG: sodium:solute symporter family protein, partial [Bacteroidetes bacterium]|nr:sodium:solute symporter family protein [Bacteroidota bacterium]